jgi:hypothetical protein
MTPNPKGGDTTRKKGQRAEISDIISIQKGNSQDRTSNDDVTLDPQPVEIVIDAGSELGFGWGGGYRRSIQSQIFGYPGVEWTFIPSENCVDASERDPEQSDPYK